MLQADLRFGFGTRKGFGQAVGNFSPAHPLFLSTPGQLLSCTFQDLWDVPARQTDLKEILEGAVAELRECAGTFEGASYAG